MRPLAARSPLVLRADADKRIGIGHLMRCLALAQAWRRHGGRAVFCGRIQGEALHIRLKTEGFDLITLEKPHPDARDLDTIRQTLATFGNPGWIVLDGYHLTPDYQLAVRETGWRVLLVDDTAHHGHYHADIVLNQNIYAQELAYRTDPETLLLLGTRYLLLREEFLSRRQEKRQVPVQARRILITLGGADRDNASAAILEGLAATGRQDLSVRLVVGPANPHAIALEEKRRHSPFALEIVRAAEDMPGHMVWADAAVSSGGTTSWEMAYLGVPFAVAILADNQQKVVAALSARGAALSLGSMGDWRRDELAEVFADLLGNNKLRLGLQEEGMKLVDGRGAERVVRAALSFDFEFRRSRSRDCELVFEWANDALVRKASFRPEPILWENHCSWFSRRLADPACFFYLATTATGEPLGQARFELEGGIAVISISIGPEWRGCGLGPRLIRHACARLRQEQEVEKVRAFIRKENDASENSFRKAGFKRTGETIRAGVPAVIMEWNLEEAA